jgi:hypothetical protein
MTKKVNPRPLAGGARARDDLAAERVGPNSPSSVPGGKANSVRWLHVHPDGREECFAEQPLGVPSLRVEADGDGYERTFTLDGLALRRAADEPHPERFVGGPLHWLVVVPVPPKGQGWVMRGSAARYQGRSSTAWQRPCPEGGE